VPNDDAADEVAVDEVVDELYGLPLDDFTAARNAAAKALTKAGDKDAAAVKKLAKPTLAAWALNQMARAEPAIAGAVLDTGSRVVDAQSAALAGDASKLRTAAKDHDAAVDAALAAAGAVLATRGPVADAQIDRMRATLRATATNADAAELLRRGRLAVDLSPSGFGLDAAADVTLAPPAKRARTARPKAPTPQEQVAERAAAHARDAAREKARRTLEKAEAEVERLELAAEDARLRLSAARARLDEARARAVEADGR
jgi:hypothetical protein